jgi:hypothetical protein
MKFNQNPFSSLVGTCGQVDMTKVVGALCQFSVAKAARRPGSDVHCGQAVREHLLSSGSRVRSRVTLCEIRDTLSDIGAGSL